jgi:hypothetical protein
MKSAHSLLEAGYASDEVEQCTRDTKAQPFWRDKALQLRHVADEIAQWKLKPKEGNNGRTATTRASPGQGHTDPEADALAAKYGHLD